MAGKSRKLPVFRELKSLVEKIKLRWRFFWLRLHQALWTVCGGEGSGNGSERRDDGKGLLAEVIEYIMTEETVLGLKILSNYPGPMKRS